MKYITILILFVSFSCQKKPNAKESKQIFNVQYNKTFFGDFIYKNKIDYYSDTMRIYLEHFNFSNCNELESLLKNIYKRDQQYRDSLQINNDLDSLLIKRYGKQVVLSDHINKEMLKYIFRIIGWPDTRGMDSTAHYALWYVIFHSHDIEFINSTKTHIKKAFDDSIISPQYYASLIDKINVRSGNKQIYGTYPSYDIKGKKIIIPQISIGIDSINIERELIGLDRINL